MARGLGLNRRKGLTVNGKHFLEVIERIRLLQGFVLTPSGDTRKAQCDAGLVARTCVDSFESDFKDMLGRHLSHGTETLLRILADPGGNSAEFFIAQPGIGFRERHEIIAVPDCKGEIGDFDKVSFQESVKKHLSATYATTIENADSRAWYLAMGRALAELTTFDLLETENDEKIKNAKSVNYLSLEFLIGRLTGNNLISMGLYEQITHAMEELGQNLTDLLEEERDPSLGNGGLGRLAACFMDSCAAQEYPTVGYGLHYEYGLFKQSFQDGRQQEAPDAWPQAFGSRIFARALCMWGYFA